MKSGRTPVGLGLVPGADDTFDNLPSLIGRRPRTLAQFAEKHAELFRY